MDQSAEEKKAIDDKITALKNSKFKQQMLPAWRPVPSFGSTMITFSMFGIVFLAIGIALYVMSDKIQEFKYNYSNDADADENPGCGVPKEISAMTMNLDDMSGLGNECEKTIEITDKMTGPVFVYYQLDNFYQNHRRYVKSKDYKQLMGATIEVADLSQCDPITTNANLANVNIVNNVATPPVALDPTAAAIPCGLIAKSVFTDSFELINKTTSAKVPIY